MAATRFGGGQRQRNYTCFFPRTTSWGRAIYVSSLARRLEAEQSGHCGLLDASATCFAENPTSLLFARDRALEWTQSSSQRMWDSAAEPSLRRPGNALMCQLRQAAAAGISTPYLRPQTVTRHVLLETASVALPQAPQVLTANREHAVELLGTSIGRPESPSDRVGIQSRHEYQAWADRHSRRSGRSSIQTSILEKFK